MQLENEELRRRALSAETDEAQRVALEKASRQAQRLAGSSTQAAIPTSTHQDAAHLATAAIGPLSLPASSILTSASAATAAAAASADKGETHGLPHQAYKPAAHIYSLLHAPWIRNVSLGRPRPPINPNSLERFQSAESRADGIVAEVMDLIPRRLHESLVQHSEIQSLVS